MKFAKLCAAADGGDGEPVAAQVAVRIGLRAKACSMLESSHITPRLQSLAQIWAAIICS